MKEQKRPLKQLLSEKRENHKSCRDPNYETVEYAKFWKTKKNSSCQEWGTE